MPRGYPEEPDLASLDARADQGAVRAEARADVVLRGQQQSARDRVPEPAVPGPVPANDPVAGAVEGQVDPLGGVPDPGSGAEGGRLGVPEENGAVAGAGQTPAVRVPGDAVGPGEAVRVLQRLSLGPAYVKDAHGLTTGHGKAAVCWLRMKRQVLRQVSLPRPVLGRVGGGMKSDLVDPFAGFEVVKADGLVEVADGQVLAAGAEGD